MGWVYRLPAGALLAVALVVAVGLAVSGQILVQRRFRHIDMGEHNELGGVLVVVAASLYAVLLGFMTVVAWEHFQEARGVVVAESDASIDAWHTAVGLPPAVRARVRADMAAYATGMADREWALMREGRFDPNSAILSMDALDATGGLKPADGGETNAQMATITQLDVLHDARQRRIAMNDAGVSAFEWTVLLLGAVCIVGFCWLFGARNPIVHLVMTSTVVVVITSTLLLLFELQYPFRSDVEVARKPWEDAVAHIHQMQTGRMTDMRM